MASLKDKKIGVLAGGWSEEREVSLRSGKNVLDALHALGYKATLIDPAEKDIKNFNIDLAFIALHGKFGEDGTVQGHLEILGIPYTGSGVLASATGMNKLSTKTILKAQSLPTAAHWRLNNTEKPLSGPCVVKPILGGSSIGVSIINTKKALDDHILKLSPDLGQYFVEDYIPGKEITVGLLEDPRRGLLALPVLELKPQTSSFYDYYSKYTKGETEFILPSTLSDETEQQCQDYAKKLHEAVGCRGFSRVDMIVHPEKGPFILEINTIPGLTTLSDVPAQANAFGISFNQLVETILYSAL